MMRGTIGGCGRRHAAMQHENGSMQHRTEALDARHYRQLHRTLWSNAMRIGPSHPPPPALPARACVCAPKPSECARARTTDCGIASATVRAHALPHLTRALALKCSCPCGSVGVHLVAVGPHSAQQSCVAHAAASGESVPVATAYFWANTYSYAVSRGELVARDRQRDDRHK